MANLVERMWLAMSFIIVLLLPLSRVLPPLYTFRVRSRIFRWYGQLRDIEVRSDNEDRHATSKHALLQELNDLESRAEKNHRAAVLQR